MPRRLGVSEVNAHVMCTICDGYLVDATAIIECLHAFCRTCIVRYLESSKYCPVCDVQVHKTKPLNSIRSDQTLQDVVYKMVPGLYQNEMQRRRDFYAEHPEAGSSYSPEERGEAEPRFFSPKESISLCLQHRHPEQKSAELSNVKDPTTRHLNCPAAFSIGHLKKFVHLKFSLPNTYAVEIFYNDHLLRDSFTLMDVAYIYSWKRAEPMKFFYIIKKHVPKQMEPPTAPPASEVASSVTREPAKISEEITIDTNLDKCPEPMEIDSKPSKSERIEVIAEKTSQHLITSDGFDASTSPSTGKIQQMEIGDLEVTESNSSTLLATESMVPIPVPEPTYNSVKLVSAPERNTLLSPTNGFRLKFIHDPELNPKSRSSKKSSRKEGRSSRQKSIPIRLARLAPYPPPPPPLPPVPVTCLTTQHLPQLTVGKLVPSVIKTLAPTFVTTLVSTTTNTLCNMVNNSCTASQTSSFSSPVSKISSGPFPARESHVSLSPTLLESPQKSVPSPDTKELLSAETPPVVSSSASSHTVAISLPFPMIKDTSLTPSAVSAPEMSDLAVKISSDSCFSKTDGDLAESAAVSCPSDVESSKLVTTMSACVNPVPTASINTIQCTDPDSRGSFRENSLGKPPERNCIPQMASVKSESFKLSVKNSISAEFSDNDDLGCQPDLVVDEQKIDSSEEEEDTALRKKINAIAEKEDETDDTEADSGRASDMSCPARCEEEVGSPMTTEVVTSSSVTTTSTVSVAVLPPEETHRQNKTNSIDHVIKQLYLQHEMGRSPSSPKSAASPHHIVPSSPKDESGVLDLSTCTRKTGDVQNTRSKSVANPVLDFKHRQQTYLPAPMKQHTACPPAPKHPTSSLLMHQLTTHQHPTPSILQAQLTGGAKPMQFHHPSHHHHHHHHNIPYSIPVNRNAVTSSSSSSSSPSLSSSSSLAERSSYSSYKFSPNAAHQGVFSSMFPMMNLAASYGLVPPGLSLPPRSPSASHQKEYGASNSSGKVQFVCGLSKQGSVTGRRVSDTLPSPSSRSTLTSSTGAPTHPRASPSLIRMSPLHRSASPAPSPQSVASMVNHCSSSLSSIVNKKNSVVGNSNSSVASSVNSGSGLSSSTVNNSLSSSPSSRSQCRPVHKEKKTPNKVKKKPNLAVFNLDPNGYRQKLVIKNLDSKQNNRH